MLWMRGGKFVVCMEASLGREIVVVVVVGFDTKVGRIAHNKEVLVSRKRIIFKF